MTLIEIQEKAIAEMREPRSSGRRAVKSRYAAIGRYRERAHSMGYTDEQVAQQVRDVWDIYQLRVIAEEAVDG